MSRRRQAAVKRRSVWRIVSATVTALVFAIAALGVWFVHHPRDWIDERRQNWPGFVVDALLAVGNPVGDFTDAIALTGCDVKANIKRASPANAVTFAGDPVRRGGPAPDDIVVLDRGEFRIGWSPSLRHCVWCAYHIPQRLRHEVGPRPNFRPDRRAANCPRSSDYTSSGYDRGHMAPNYAIASRFGPEQQAQTFLLSNVTPQSPALNRGVWRDFEHRIAELWTERWGEIWVIVGCISETAGETLSGTDVDVPRKFYQIAVAQQGDEVRALAVMFEQEVPWRAYPARYIVSIAEIERQTGLVFLPSLPDDVAQALKRGTPTRLWPIDWRDILRLVALRYR